MSDVANDPALSGVQSERAAPTFHRAGRAAAGGRSVGPRGSAAIPQVAAGTRRSAAEGRSQSGSSGPTSGQAQRLCDPAGWSSGPGARPPGQAEPLGWAVCGDSVSGSWGSASRNRVQTGNLQQTEQEWFPSVITEDKGFLLKSFQLLFHC